MSAKLSLRGAPTFLLGVNYWSRAGGPRMWERFAPDQVAAELHQQRRIGLNVCRSFAFIPSFMPRPPAVTPAAVDHFRRFLDLCQQAGLATIPSLLVGHMSGENHDFSGQAGRDLYTDPELLAWQQALIRQVAAAARRHPAVAAYLASNEMPLWGGHSQPAAVAAWAAALRQAVQETDPGRPFSLGDGAMLLEGRPSGFDPRTLAGLVDFLGPHTYYCDQDPLRQAFNAELCVRALTSLGLPVVLEEFGCSASQASERAQALYYRETLHSCLSAGAAGALGWCYSDLDLPDDPPYDHHAFELGFGITRADGSEKPVCQELRDFAALLEQVDYPTLCPPKPQAAILIPSYFTADYPFCQDDRARMRRCLLQAYTLCGQAGLETELIFEGQDLSPYRLLLLPTTQKLRATTWRSLLSHANAGNTVYWSYFCGDDPFLQGMWCQLFGELTGLQHQRRYGCFDLPRDPLQLEGALQLSLRTSSSRPCPRSYLPVKPAGAEVLARDQLGQTALSRQQLGQGQLLFCAYPLEYYLAEQADGDPRGELVALYRLIARYAGLAPACNCSQPGVQLRQLASAAGPLLWVFNRSWSELTAWIDSPGGQPLYGAAVPLREGLAPLPLAGKQVALYRLRQP